MEKPLIFMRGFIIFLLFQKRLITHLLAIDLGVAGMFQPWITKADVFNKVNQPAEAEANMKKTLVFAYMKDKHQ